MNTLREHDRARRLVLDRSGEALNDDDARWLDDHLDHCASCAAVAAAAGRAIGILKSVSEAPSPTLVRATQRALRAAAGSIREAESHRRMVVISSVLAAAWGAAMQPLLWKLLGWIGARLDLPDPVWQAAFMMMWLLPGIVAVLLLAHRPLGGLPAHRPLGGLRTTWTRPDAPGDSREDGGKR